VQVVSLYKDKDEQTSERVRQASLRTQNEQALLEMSQHKLNVAAGALVQVLESLPQVRSPSLSPCPLEGAHPTHHRHRHHIIRAAPPPRDGFPHFNSINYKITIAILII
jgi:hypothetical protein